MRADFSDHHDARAAAGAKRLLSPCCHAADILFHAIFVTTMRCARRVSYHHAAIPCRFRKMPCRHLFCHVADTCLMLAATHYAAMMLMLIDAATPTVSLMLLPLFADAYAMRCHHAAAKVIDDAMPCRCATRCYHAACADARAECAHAIYFDADAGAPCLRHYIILMLRCFS